MSTSSMGSSSDHDTAVSAVTQHNHPTPRRRPPQSDDDDDEDRDDYQTASTSANPSPPAIRRPKRGPLQSVCLHCRRAKLRCNREAPCMHCRKQSIECVYPSFAPDDREEQGGGATIRRRRRRLRIQPPPPSAVVVDIVAPPSLPASDHLAWRDHLFSFFPGSRAQTQRTLVALFRNIPALIYREHYFSLFHMDAPIQAITRPASTLQDYPLDVHPAFIYALVAFALRMRLRPQRKATSLIPLEGVPVPADRDDVAMRIQREAEVLLSQSLTDPFVGVNKALSVGQAAAMVMKLQPEFTQAHSFYWTIVHQLTTSPLFRSYTDDDGTLSINRAPTPTALPSLDAIAHRDSIRAENAARLRLITLWTSLRQGYVFPNFEVLMGRFTLQDIDHATVYTPFVDEVSAAKRDATQIIRAKQAAAMKKEPAGSDKAAASPPSANPTVLRYDLGADDDSGLLLPLSFRSELFRFVTRCTTSWQIAQLDYVSPSADFAALLTSMDQRDAAGRAIQAVLAVSASAGAAPRSPLLKKLFAKRTVACAYLQGFLVRRIGIVHSAAIRPYVVQALRGHVKAQQQADEATPPAWQRPFDSPTLMAWVELMRMFLQEVDEDYKAAIAPPPPSATPTPLTLSHFSLDSMLLYAAASEQYGQGVAQVYRILSHPQPTTQPLARALFDVANGLRMYVHRHRALHHQRGNPGPEPVRITL